MSASKSDDNKYLLFGEDKIVNHFLSYEDEQAKESIDSFVGDTIDSQMTEIGLGIRFNSAIYEQASEIIVAFDVSDRASFEKAKTKVMLLNLMREPDLLDERLPNPGSENYEMLPLDEDVVQFMREQLSTSDIDPELRHQYEEMLDKNLLFEHIEELVYPIGGIPEMPTVTLFGIRTDSASKDVISEDEAISFSARNSCKYINYTPEITISGISPLDSLNLPQSTFGMAMAPKTSPRTASDESVSPREKKSPRGLRAMTSAVSASFSSLPSAPSMSRIQMPSFTSKSSNGDIKTEKKRRSSTSKSRSKTTHDIASLERPEDISPRDKQTPRRQRQVSFSDDSTVRSDEMSAGKEFKQNILLLGDPEATKALMGYDETATKMREEGASTTVMNYNNAEDILDLSQIKDWNGRPATASSSTAAAPNPYEGMECTIFAFDPSSRASFESMKLAMDSNPVPEGMPVIIVSKKSSTELEVSNDEVQAFISEIRLEKRIHARHKPFQQLAGFGEIIDHARDLIIKQPKKGIESLEANFATDLRYNKTLEPTIDRIDALVDRHNLPDGHLKARAMYLKGRALERTGDLRAAERCFEYAFNNAGDLDHEFQSAAKERFFAYQSTDEIIEVLNKVRTQNGLLSGDGEVARDPKNSSGLPKENLPILANVSHSIDYILTKIPENTNDLKERENRAKLVDWKRMTLDRYRQTISNSDAKIPEYNPHRLNTAVPAHRTYVTMELSDIQKTTAAMVQEFRRDASEAPQLLERLDRQLLPNLSAQAEGSNGHNEAIFLKGRLLQSTGDLENAKLCFEQVASKSTDPQLLDAARAKLGDPKIANVNVAGIEAPASLFNGKTFTAVKNPTRDARSESVSLGRARTGSTLSLSQGSSPEGTSSSTDSSPQTSPRSEPATPETPRRNNILAGEQAPVEQKNGGFLARTRTQTTLPPALPTPNLNTMPIDLGTTVPSSSTIPSASPAAGHGPFLARTRSSTVITPSPSSLLEALGIAPAVPNKQPDSSLSSSTVLSSPSSSSSTTLPEGLGDAPAAPNSATPSASTASSSQDTKKTPEELAEQAAKDAALLARVEAARARRGRSQTVSGNSDRVSPAALLAAQTPKPSVGDNTAKLNRDRSGSPDRGGPSGRG